MFQSTRPHGARQILFSSYTPAAGVSIHAPAWGATAAYPPYEWVFLLFQSTRPHGARLEERALEERAQAVSIHAPAWGATCRPRGAWSVENVSIHAPAWGATVKM